MRRSAKDFGVMIPELHEGQQRVKDNLKKRNYICAHRGWRKSSFGIHLAIEHLLKGHNVGWYAPTFNVVTSSNWVDFKRACYGNDYWFNKSESSWTIPGCGTCFFFSVDRPGTARGGTFTLAIGEEMGEWQDGVFESVVQPIVKKVDGTFVGIGTPNTVLPYNDFYKRIQSAKNYPESHASFLIPAWGADFVDGILTEGVAGDYQYISRELPFRAFQDLVEDYEMSDDKMKWRVEYLCRFESSAGGQFSGVSECCILPTVIKND